MRGLLPRANVQAKSVRERLCVDNLAYPQRSSSLYPHAHGSADAGVCGSVYAQQDRPRGTAMFISVPRVGGLA